MRTFNFRAVLRLWANVYIARSCCNRPHLREKQAEHEEDAGEFGRDAT